MMSRTFWTSWKRIDPAGIRCDQANSGSKACEIYTRRSGEIGCVLMDLIMPGMSGLETYSRLKDINPGVRVILSSGYSSGRVRSEAAEVGSPEFLEKALHTAGAVTSAAKRSIETEM